MLKKKSGRVVLTNLKGVSFICPFYIVTDDSGTQIMQSGDIQLSHFGAMIFSPKFQPPILLNHNFSIFIFISYISYIQVIIDASLTSFSILIIVKLLPYIRTLTIHLGGAWYNIQQNY